MIQTEQEREDIVANYLPPLAPSWDGSHLTWLWARMREQTIFFPWYRKSQADRLDFDVPQPAALHAALLDFMRSGDHYRVGYRAAFTMRSDAALATLRVPALITAAKSDVLSSHLPRVLRKSEGVTVQQGGGFFQVPVSVPRLHPAPRATTAPRLTPTPAHCGGDSGASSSTCPAASCASSAMTTRPAGPWSCSTTPPARPRSSMRSPRASSAIAR